MIKNVKNAGTITRDSKFAAGIVGLAHGKVTVSGCDLTVTINFNVNGDGTHGGIVGLTGDYSNMTVEGCYFRGFVKGYSIIGCGGIVGFARYSQRLYACGSRVYPHAKFDHYVLLLRQERRNHNASE